MTCDGVCLDHRDARLLEASDDHTIIAHRYKNSNALSDCVPLFSAGNRDTISDNAKDTPKIFQKNFPGARHGQRTPRRLPLCKNLAFGGRVRTGERLGHRRAHGDAHGLAVERTVLGHPIRFLCLPSPLAFLLPRILMTMGLPDVQSVQIIAALATLASFFCIRSLLKHLDLLTKPIELAFLYITFSLPFLIYLSHAVTMDVLILLAACGALLHGWKFSDAKTERQRLLHGLLSVFWLMFALYAKYNGVLLLPLPLLIAGCSGRGKRLRRLAEAACMVAAAIALAFPLVLRTDIRPGRTVLRQ